MTMHDKRSTGAHDAWSSRFRAVRPDSAGHAARRIELSRVVSAVIGANEKPRLGRFIVEEKIAEGGMGIVYRARDPMLDRDVALKVLKSDSLDRDRDEALKEAKALARMSHPAVIAVYDIGTTDGDSFIAMEYVVGCSLGRWLEEHRDAAAPDVVRLFLQAATGLAAAHRCGVIHRDFKPDNVLVGTDGRVRVADFGLARIAPPLCASSTTPGERHVVGTPRFMAPEQRRGQRVDGRSDQYSFCLSLWRALEPEAEPGTHCRRIPPSLRSLLMRGLQDDPDLRWPSMDDLAAALTRVLERWPEERMRSVLIDRVEQRWIANTLDASLGGREPVALPLRDVSDRVGSPRNAVRARVDEERVSSVQLSSCLEAAHGSLLLLGAPGAGKTTALLSLARQLAAKARVDPTAPVPVVLDLASYTDASGPLDAWVIAELITRYGVIRRRARSWLEKGTLTLLLDGLDEVASSARRACVEAINAFRTRYAARIVVTCREDEHAGIGARLELGGAALVEPLDDRCAEAILAGFAEPGRLVRAALHRNVRLAHRARTPFMLLALLVAGPAVMANPGSLWGELLCHLVDCRRGLRARYAREITLQGLRWLARLAGHHERAEPWIELQVERPVLRCKRLSGLVGTFVFVGVLTAAAHALASWVARGLQRLRPVVWEHGAEEAVP
jgi:predicted Ser/Thr protein kinase